ncbi:MAG: DUF169 domain-containing protein, partial [Dehalococcoidia bacterium]
MSHREIAEQLESGLHLDVPVIALAFVDSAPPEVAQFEQEVPAACSFWRQAETAVFYAPAAKHLNCPIGAMTMGFEMPETTQQRLMGLVTMMCENGYIAADEPEKIPTSGKQAAGIVYGPLAELPVEPDLVLMWLTPRQAMLYSEAVGTARWTTPAPATVWGRPACAALPGALTSNRSTLSFGCTGMRTFTDVREDRLLAVLPGKQAREFAGSLSAVLESNEKM